jgi:putative phosphoribosyl transferase
MNRPNRTSTANQPSVAAFETEVQIDVGEFSLNGSLELPAEAIGLVLFAHGSGSSRFSTRNRRVASQLRAAGLGTLLFDLLTKREEHEDAYSGYIRFNVSLLADRLHHAARWVHAQERTSHLPLGYFGASTGAAAALIAAAAEPEIVHAVVSRGGRPDLAGDALPAVRAPTLLIVGGDDEPVIPLNEEALDRLQCEKRLEIVPGASHLFEEPGTLEMVAKLAAWWFGSHLERAAHPSRMPEP